MPAFPADAFVSRRKGVNDSLVLSGERAKTTGKSFLNPSDTPWFSPSRLLKVIRVINMVEMAAGRLPLLTSLDTVPALLNTPPHSK